MKQFYIIFFFIFPTTFFAQCVTCGNGIIDAGETFMNCPQDVSHDASCSSPCSQSTAYETTTGLRLTYDFTGTTIYGAAALPTGWAFAGAPAPTTAGTLPAADTYGAKGGLVQPNCSGGCTSTNGFCIGNLANTSAVGAGGTNGKLGANFDGRANINQNLSYAVLRGQSNPTLVSPTFNMSAVEGFKLQFWLFPSETSCSQTNGWASCTGNQVFLDFSTNGTSWAQILTMDLSSTNNDMCTNNSSNTLWLNDGDWSRVCLTVFKSTTSPGNFYLAADAGSAASGIMVNSSYFSSTFRYRIRYAQTASCTSGITTINPGRYLAIDYPVITSGDEMIPCGISFSNMCGYGADNNDDGVGSTAATTSTLVFSTVKRGVNNAERGVEILTSQTNTFSAQNLSGSSSYLNYDLCNAEGGDQQCIDWRNNTNFYYAVYECITDWEAPSGSTGINVQYYNGVTPQSTGMTKVTTAGKTALLGWRYIAANIVSCGSSSDLNPGCNGYGFRSTSLPTKFARGFYQLAINPVGKAWTFYGATSCSNYFNGPVFSPIAEPDTVTGSGNFIACNSGSPVFTGMVNYCSSPVGFTGSAQLVITGPNGFNETINSGGMGTIPVIDPGTYTIVAMPPSSPVQCVDCSRSACVTITAADLNPCLTLPVDLLNFEGSCKNDDINLSWCTASEKNNNYFIIEQSINGIDFRETDTIKGNGNAEEKHCYTAKATSLVDITYFRLLQSDNGKEKTSEYKIISVASCNSYNKKMKLAHDGSRQLNVIMYSEIDEVLHLSIHDVFGHLVQTETLDLIKGNNTLTVNLNSELKGMYSVSVYSPTEKLLGRKILITEN